MGIADAGLNGRGIAVLDADGDGLFDIVYGNWEGPHRLFLQRAGGGFADATPEEMAEPSRIRTVIAADFDNDGMEEIFFNNIGQPNRLFAWSHGRWTEVEIGDAEEPHGLGTGAAVADIDGDGRLELLISHGESAPQPLSFYRPYPNDNAWLRVMPLTSGRCAGAWGGRYLHGQGTDPAARDLRRQRLSVPDGAGGAFRAEGGPFGRAGGGALAGRDGARHRAPSCQPGPAS